MIFIRSKCCVILLVTVIAPALSDLESRLTPNQHSRIRQSYIEMQNDKKSLFDEKSQALFKVIHSRPENANITFQPCDSKPLLIPDFGTARISEVKCLEHLWKMRYYDEALIGLTLCDKLSMDVSLINLNFGGFDAVAGEYAHMGAIGWQTLNDTWLFMCEGALISEKYMLTTAQCTRLLTHDPRVQDVTPKVVRFGVTDISDKEEIGKSPTDVFIQRIIVHPYYQSESNYYDIAIIELDRELVFSTQVHPACIWTDHYNLTDKDVVLAGWNVVESKKTVKAKEFVGSSLDVFTRLSLAQKITPQEKKKSNASDPMMKLGKVKLLDSIQCDRLTKCKRDRSWRGLIYSQLCAFSCRVDDNSTNGNDIGTILQAPVVIPEYTDWRMHYLIGLKSFSFGETSYPYVYTKVSAFLEWIENTVWGSPQGTNKLQVTDRR
ncbi:unnamed protein product, partial [Iphiclides podalirius]